MVSLRPIDDSNREAVEGLRVSPGQDRFVSGVAESLVEAAEEPDGRALPWGVYADETPVGFVMISDEVGSPDYIRHHLWKLLIDARYQRRGGSLTRFAGALGRDLRLYSQVKLRSSLPSRRDEESLGRRRTHDGPTRPTSLGAPTLRRVSGCRS